MVFKDNLLYQQRKVAALHLIRSSMQVAIPLRHVFVVAQCTCDTIQADTSQNIEYRAYREGKYV